VSQADVNFDDGNFDCTNNAFEVIKNHQQYMKTFQSKDENRAFLSATKSGMGKPPTAPKQKDARSFLIGDFSGMPAELSVYILSKKRNKNFHPHIMFSALDEDEKKLLKMWNDMDSKRKSKDYNALYTQYEPVIKSLIQAVTARAARWSRLRSNCPKAQDGA
jgi:hypothetical protein